MSLLSRASRSMRAAFLAVTIGAVAVPVVTASPAAADPFPTTITCTTQYHEPIAPNTDPLVVTTGIPGAPSYYEFGFPTANAPTFQPKGYMLLIHGGAWAHVGPGMAESMRFFANVWRSRGWATLNVTYRACAASIQDVFWYYDVLRTSKGPNAVICAQGASAGGHLAMMIAGIYPDLDCAISMGGPLWLDELHHQASYNGNTQSPEEVSGYAQGAFGLPPSLTFSSPHAWENNIGDTRFLIATAQNDVLIPLAQGRDYGAAVLAYNPGAYVHVYEAPVGSDAPFVHGSTTTAGANAYWAAEDALVDPLV